MSMTSDAANIALCNNALDLLGAERITVLDITDQNHIYCTGQFDQSRDEILENHKWNWAKKRAYALETTSPLFGYDNAFTYPTDCLKVWMIDQDPSAKFEVEGGLILTDEGDTPPDYDDDSVEYLAGQYLQYSDVTYLVDTAFTSSAWATDLIAYMTTQTSDLQILEVEYVYQSTAVSSYPAYLYQCCVLNLAIKVGPAIKQNEKAALNLQAMLYGSKNVTGYLDIARSIDAQEQGGVEIQTSGFIDSRG